MVEQVIVCVDGGELPKLDSVKYLGVFIDKNLNWKLYIDDVRPKC